MSPKKYVSLSKLSTFLDNLYNKFSLIGHKHTLSDITNYTVDSQLSSTSTNPVQNNVIDAEFEAMSIAMNVLEEAIDGKANSTHTHSDIYYTKGEVDNAIDAAADELQENINTVSAAVELLTNGASADEIDSVNDLIDYVNEHGAEVTGMKADIAANTKAIADQATLDAATYEKKTDASAKLAEAKSYTDQKIAAIPTPDVSAQIATHNTSSTAHADIRDEIVASQSVIMGTINAAATEFSASWLSNINPSEDKIYVVKDENMLCRWDGTSYVRLNVGIPTKSTYKFTATNATNTFTIPTSVYDPLTCTLELIQENVVLVDGENYTITNNIVNLIDYNLEAGESIYYTVGAIAYGASTLIDTHLIDTKANKAIMSAVTIYATGWNNNTYSFESTYPFGTYDISLELNGDSCTAEQMNAWSDAKILGSATSNKIKALGNVPTVNIPVIVRAVQK